MRKIKKEYQGKGYVEVVNLVRKEAAGFSSTDGRARIIDSALGNASDTVGGKELGSLDQWIKDRGLERELPEFVVTQDKIDLAWAVVAYSGICSNTTAAGDFGATRADVAWLNRRGFIG